VTGRSAARGARAQNAVRVLLAQLPGEQALPGMPSPEGLHLPAMADLDAATAVTAGLNGSRAGAWTAFWGEVPVSMCRRVVLASTSGFLSQGPCLLGCLGWMSQEALPCPLFAWAYFHRRPWC